MITITKVALSPDLKDAKVYFTTLGDSIKDLNILEGAKGFIRTTLAHRIRIKFVPDLKFLIDDSPQYGEKIDRLLKEINKDDKNEQ